MRRAPILLSLATSLLLGGVDDGRAADCGAATYEGRRLAEALESLRSCGLEIVYSSDLVRPDLVVEAEPADASPRRALDDLLAPHDLAAVDGPGGRVMVVRRGGPSRAPGGVRGRVVSRSSALPVPRARIRIVGTPFDTFTARDGSFRIDGIPPGALDIEVLLGERPLGVFDGIRVEPDEVTRLRLEVAHAPSFIEELVVTPSRYEMARDEPEPRQRIPSEGLQDTPNLGSDVHRAVSRLPGLAGADRSAQLNIRGGDADEVLFVLDGLEILDPFHLKAFQSFSGIVDARAIGRADILTGSFPAEYGDRMSGVVDLSSTPLSGERRTILGANFINSHFLSSGSAGSGGGQWLLSARAWYPDALNLVVAPAGEEIGPKFTDLLGKVRFRLGDATTISGNVLMSYDAVDFREEESEVDEELTARARSGYAWLNLDSAWTPRLYSRTLLSFGQITAERSGSSRSDLEGATTVRDVRSFDVHGIRQDWSYRASDSVLLKIGVEAKRVGATYDYSAGFRDGAGREVSVAPSGDETGAFLSGRFRVLAPLTAEVGLRWDRQSHTSEDQLSPRINVLYAPGARSALRLGWGHFYQSQGVNELPIEDGVEGFFPAQRSEHRVISFEHDFRAGLHLRLNAYSKEISNPRPRFENLFDPVELFPEAAPDRVRIAPDRAEARGIEVFLKSQPGRRLSWWASYARASVEDEIDGERVPRSWDQKDTFNFGLSYRPSPLWSLNVAGIYHSGWPTTAVRAVAVSSPEGSPEIQPILGPRNAERFAAYHRLDLKVSRHVPLRRGRLTLFVEVLNLYDRQNPCCVDEFRFTPLADGGVRTTRKEDFWLGRLPTLGVVWELGR